MFIPSDTIFALATPPAKSGVAVIRVSGPRARRALITLTGRNEWQPNRLYPVPFGAIDRGLAAFFAHPKSFTGEDVAELHCHGSLTVIRELLDALSEMDGLRHAEPGEFTRRAYLNGKLDLLEAEGLADLIDAETPAQRRAALSQLGGNASRHYEKLRARIVESLALLEATIDFPDEDIPESTIRQVEQNVAEIKAAIAETLADNQSGERLREGVRVVILGAPNAGKSSLLNLLAGRDAAIVSERAGTTRDVIEVPMNIGGFPVLLTDTAGLRDAADEIEEEGVRRALQRAGEADISLVLLDATRLPAIDELTIEQITEKSIILVNKCDLVDDCHPERSRGILDPSTRLRLAQDDIFRVSAKTGQGTDKLLKILEYSISSLFSNHLSPMITRRRHRELLERAQGALDRFSLDQPLELACEELRLAAHAVGGITGKIAVDEVLDVVFKQFCIGK